MLGKFRLQFLSSKKSILSAKTQSIYKLFESHLVSPISHTHQVPLAFTPRPLNSLAILRQTCRMQRAHPQITGSQRPPRRASQIGQGKPPSDSPVIKYRNGGNSARHESSPSAAPGKAAWDGCAGAGLAIKRGAPHASTSRSLDSIAFVAPNLHFR